MHLAWMGQIHSESGKGNPPYEYFKQQSLFSQWALPSHSGLCFSFWHHCLKNKSAAVQILEYFPKSKTDLLLPRNIMPILWARRKRNWSIMFYCNLNIYRSIANESHLSNFRNNSQRKTFLFSWPVTSMLPRFPSSQNWQSVFRPHPMHT